MTMYYVTMTDKFMSRWGMSENKINKLVFVCDTYEQAENVFDNASNRNEMKHINITTNKPYYNSSRYYAQTKTIEEYPHWFRKGFFK